MPASHLGMARPSQLLSDAGCWACWTSINRQPFIRQPANATPAHVHLCESVSAASFRARLPKTSGTPKVLLSRGHMEELPYSLGACVLSPRVEDSAWWPVASGQEAGMWVAATATAGIEPTRQTICAHAAAVRVALPTRDE
ncbi:hypothetical protein HaLaN_03628 [Haematococcus lacustris]|uniref:Uncharacterized protein n=1 Tax=Haematococcus lacustris TaxID=44745 RepID=A0A699YR23_HAELA|nr:hypothetical protein HaLaN_03628 [Haematococcus lacustris]